MNKKELLDNIQPKMKLTKNFFMQIYGFELSYPGYAEECLTKLEDIGCNKARKYYQHFVGEYNLSNEDIMKNVAAWYRNQVFYSKKGDEENIFRKQRGRVKFTGFPEDW